MPCDQANIPNEILLKSTHVVDDLFSLGDTKTSVSPSRCVGVRVSCCVQSKLVYPVRFQLVLSRMYVKPSVSRTWWTVHSSTASCLTCSIRHFGGGEVGPRRAGPSRVGSVELQRIGLERTIAFDVLWTSLDMLNLVRDVWIRVVWWCDASSFFIRSAWNTRLVNWLFKRCPRWTIRERTVRKRTDQCVETRLPGLTFLYPRILTFIFKIHGSMYPGPCTTDLAPAVPGNSYPTHLPGPTYLVPFPQNHAIGILYLWPGTTLPRPSMLNSYTETPPP